MPVFLSADVISLNNIYAIVMRRRLCLPVGI